MRAARHQAHQPAARARSRPSRNPRPANGSPARPSRAAGRFASAPLWFRPIRRSAGSAPGFHSPVGSGRRRERREAHRAGSETCGGRRRSRYRSAGRSPGSSPRAARTRSGVLTEVPRDRRAQECDRILDGLLARNVQQREVDTGHGTILSPPSGQLWHASRENACVNFPFGERLPLDAAYPVS